MRRLFNRRILGFFAMLLFLMTICLLSTSCCMHKWKDATCTTPKVCTKCGEIKGEALGHLWQEATCTEAAVCLRCEIRGEAAKGHTLGEATCTEAAVCSVCGESVGSALGHLFVEATCTEDGYCSRCNEKGDPATGHDFAPATCELPSTCSNCGLTQGEALGHNIENNKCTVCGKVFPTTMSIYQFEELLKEQPIYVEKTNYLVQDSRYKALYPDLLSATVKNNSGKEIKDIEIAYVAWDSNNLPVKIMAKYSFDDGYYIVECAANDINLMPGKSYGSNSGLSLDSDCDNIHTFKAIAISYTAFDGTEWTNPYYDYWVELYSGVKYSDSLTIDVIVEE